jgi:catechol 2,3-dioxygenase-like lactoylglutathione lyase family enzyme
MRTMFVAGFGPIVSDVEASRSFYESTLGLALEGDDDYRHSEAIDGCRHFALWPLADAAESCFGTREWPGHLRVPTAWIEFEVENMVQAVEQLQGDGYSLLVVDRTEPWGQVVTRLLSPDGLLAGVTITPWMRQELAVARSGAAEARTSGERSTLSSGTADPQVAGQPLEQAAG